MKQFKYEIHDEFGMLRGFDTRWDAVRWQTYCDAYNFARDDKTLWVIHNPQVKVNRFLVALKTLGNALI